MHIWAIADLHLSFGVPNKKMDPFGPQWVNFEKRVEENWKNKITADDLVLIPGDISWATHLEDALPDLEWIDSLPGTKVMIRGNHDYWWSSPTKIRKVLPPSIHIIQNDVFEWNDVSIGGARLWDTPQFHFNDFIIFNENPTISSSATKADLTDKEKEQRAAKAEKIYQRELQRLEFSLKQLRQTARLRIAMTHYPPVSADLQPSEASVLLEKYNVDICAFGHLHSVRPDAKFFGQGEHIRYLLTACDYLDFKPILID